MAAEGSCGHGHLPDREIMTGIGPVAVRAPENEVGVVCERFFKPRLRFKSYGEMNAWLLDRCVAYAKAHAHAEIKERTVFEAEWPSLVAYAGAFEGFHATPASVSKTCLVRFDNNKQVPR
jgi:hypothetical protein